MRASVRIRTLVKLYTAYFQFPFGTNLNSDSNIWLLAFMMETGGSENYIRILTYIYCALIFQMAHGQKYTCLNIALSLSLFLCLSPPHTHAHTYTYTYICACLYIYRHKNISLAIHPYRPSFLVSSLDGIQGPHRAD